MAPSNTSLAAANGKPFLFEVAWEVANKVGGIYTVLKTKVPVTVQEYGDRYMLIGPLSYKTAPMEVEALTPDPKSPLKFALDNLRAAGINFLYGRWLVQGAPAVLLFDVASMKHRINEWKADIWERASIPCPEDDFETNEAIVFGYIVAWFMGEYLHQIRRAANPHTQTASLSSASSSSSTNSLPPPSQHPLPISRKRSPVIIAHFHEWLAGIALILIKHRALEIGTIFTTHATLLGRYLCAGDVDFYNNLKDFDVDYEAGRRGIYHRYAHVAL